MARKKSSIGCLFWIALILLVLVIFLLNRNTIETVMEKTGLVTYLTKNRDEPETTEENETAGEQTEDTEKPEVPVTVNRRIEQETTPRDDEKPAETIVIQTEEQEAEDDENQPESTESPQVAQEQEPEPRARRSTIYFVQVDEDGTITLSPVSRPVQFIDSPLTDTLKALLNGLTSTEVKRGLLSLIPGETAIRGVAVRENTAYVDFNESFRFNKFGREGYSYQLKQIVYTATEFQTVYNVQFLVEGKVIPYLDSESPYVGEPLSREDLD